MDCSALLKGGPLHPPSFSAPNFIPVFFFNLVALDKFLKQYMLSMLYQILEQSECEFTIMYKKLKQVGK